MGQYIRNKETGDLERYGNGDNIASNPVNNTVEAAKSAVADAMANPTALATKLGQGALQGSGAQSVIDFVTHDLPGAYGVINNFVNNKPTSVNPFDFGKGLGDASSALLAAPALLATGGGSLVTSGLTGAALNVLNLGNGIATLSKKVEDLPSEVTKYNGAGLEQFQAQNNADSAKRNNGTVVQDATWKNNMMNYYNNNKGQLQTNADFGSSQLAQSINDIGNLGRQILPSTASAIMDVAPMFLFRKPSEAVNNPENPNIAARVGQAIEANGIPGISPNKASIQTNQFNDLTNKNDIPQTQINQLTAENANNSIHNVGKDITNFRDKMGVIPITSTNTQDLTNHIFQGDSVNPNLMLPQNSNVLTAGLLNIYNKNFNNMQPKEQSLWKNMISDSLNVNVAGNAGGVADGIKSFENRWEGAFKDAFKDNNGSTEQGDIKYQNAKSFLSQSENLYAQDLPQYDPNVTKNTVDQFLNDKSLYSHLIQIDPHSLQSQEPDTGKGNTGDILKSPYTAYAYSKTAPDIEGSELASGSDKYSAKQVVLKDLYVKSINPTTGNFDPNRFSTYMHNKFGGGFSLTDESLNDLLGEDTWNGLKALQTNIRNNPSDAGYAQNNLVSALNNVALQSGIFGGVLKPLLTGFPQPALDKAGLSVDRFGLPFRTGLQDTMYQDNEGKDNN